MTSVTSPRPASTRCCSAWRQAPADAASRSAVPASTVATLMSVPVTGARGCQVDGPRRRPPRLARLDGRACAPPTRSWPASLRRAGATVAVVAARPPREVRTFALTDLAWARAARAAALAGIAEHEPRASSTRRRPRRCCGRGRARSASTRPRRPTGPAATASGSARSSAGACAAAPLLVPRATGALAETPRPRAARPSSCRSPSSRPGRRAAHRRDIAAITYAANPEKKGLDRVLGAWVARAPRGRGARRGRAPTSASTRRGRARRRALEPAAYRALLRRARVFVSAPRREDYGDRAARGARRRLRARDDRRARARTRRCRSPARSTRASSVDDLRVARCAPRSTTRRPGYAARALQAIAPFRRARSTRRSATSCCRRCVSRRVGRPRHARLRSARELRPRPRVRDVLAAVSHARRAVATPQRVTPSVLGAVGVGVDEDQHAGLRRRRARGRR